MGCSHLISCDGMTETTTDSIEDCTKIAEEDSRLVPDAGYNVVSLKVCVNIGGNAYPCLTLLEHFKTWEEAQSAAENFTKKVSVGEVDRILVLPRTKRTTEPPERGVFTKIFADIEFNTPKNGYNLCAVDCFEEFGEQLSVIGHYKTSEEARKAKKKLAGDGPGRGYHIYPWKREVEPE